MDNRPRETRTEGDRQALGRIPSLCGTQQGEWKRLDFQAGVGGKHTIDACNADDRWEGAALRSREPIEPCSLLVGLNATLFLLESPRQAVVGLILPSSCEDIIASCQGPGHSWPCEEVSWAPADHMSWISSVSWPLALLPFPLLQGFGASLLQTA